MMKDLQQAGNRPSYILFDVYDTILDMSEVERRVNGLLDSVRGYRIWLEMFMQYCFAENCMGRFNDFSSIGDATMKMAGQVLGRPPAETDIHRILELLKHLPVHEDVQAGFSMLQRKNFRLAALTNAPHKTVVERMERTGLVSYFDKVLSVERIKKYKPCIETYEWAAKELETPPGQILLVSTHGWDIAGGAHAGMMTAQVRGAKNPLYPLAPAPNLSCKDIEDLAGRL